MDHKVDKMYCFQDGVKGCKPRELAQDGARVIFRICYGLDVGGPRKCTG
jgi:hypothetical protein